MRRVRIHDQVTGVMPDGGPYQASGPDLLMWIHVAWRSMQKAPASWTAALEKQGAADQFWLLTSRVDDGSFYPDYDGFRIVWADADWDPTRDTAKMLSQHAAAMKAT